MKSTTGALLKYKSIDIMEHDEIVTSVYTYLAVTKSHNIAIRARHVIPEGMSGGVLRRVYEQGRLPWLGGTGTLTKSAIDEALSRLYGVRGCFAPHEFKDAYVLLTQEEQIKYRLGTVYDCWYAHVRNKWIYYLHHRTATDIIKDKLEIKEDARS